MQGNENSAILWKEEEAHMQKAIPASVLSVQKCPHLCVHPEEIDPPDPQSTLKNRCSDKPCFRQERKGQRQRRLRDVSVTAERLSSQSRILGTDSMKSIICSSLIVRRLTTSESEEISAVRAAAVPISCGYRQFFVPVDARLDLAGGPSTSSGEV